jgi:hypothetical protein
MQLRSFQVRFTNGYLSQESITNMVALENIIESHDLMDIAKISFYFEGGVIPFHSLILRCIYSKTNNYKFHVEFFTYYNDENVHTQLSSDEKMNDYNLVLNNLLTSNILKERLVPNIILPSF